MADSSRPIFKIAKKLGLSNDSIRDIIVCEHEINHVYKKSELTRINLTFDKNSEKLLSKISKALNVSIDAVVLSALMTHIEQNKEK